MFTLSSIHSDAFSRRYTLTIAKGICGLIAAALFFLAALNIPLGTLNVIGAGLFFLALAVAPISF